MQLRLERIATDGDATIGVLFLDNVFQCFTLEDEARTEKVRGETRIPSGTYKIDVRAEGGLTQKYAERFPDIHHGMLWLRHVPNFEYIYLHVGNTDDDTEGCILVGEIADSSHNFSIGKSITAYRALYTSVLQAAEEGDLFIEIIDRDK